MNSITIVSTSTRRVPAPAPLPEIVETPRQDFLAGWWGGIGVVVVLGACGMFALLSVLGRLQ